MVGQCRKSFQKINEWIEDTSKFNEGFIKNYNEESDEGYFLEVKLHESDNDLIFLP